MKHIKTLVYSIVIICTLSCSDRYEFISTGHKNIKEQYKNGDIVTIVPELPLLTDSVVFHWDSRRIDKKVDMPFVCYYKLDEESLGEHEIRYIVYYRIDDNVNDSAEQDSDIKRGVHTEIYYVKVR